MARGKKIKYKLIKKSKEDSVQFKNLKVVEVKKPEEKCSNRANSFFKTEEIQEICALLNIEELGDQHCFLGAVVIEKFEIVKKLLNEGYSLDHYDENRGTALMLAATHFRLPMIEFLLNRGADISLVDSNGNTALLLAAQSPLWDQDTFSGLWLSLRDHPKLLTNYANKAGYCLLHYIIKRQWKNMLDAMILVPHLNLDCRTNKGVTPLIMAASRGYYAFVKSLLEAGADFTIEDQQKCTALCYTIAFSLQRSAMGPNKTIELILASVNDEHSKMTLESYLKRRLELLVNPPTSRTEFCKTVKSVLVHVLTFFARFIYGGIELLIELSVFHRLKEALEKHLDDSNYTVALLGVTLELVNHCDCCCQGLSQLALADEFFNAGLGKCCLEILHRNGLAKTMVLKAVFLPLIHLCTSNSYEARAWIETNQEFLQSYFMKYMRSFPVLFLETNGDVHLENLKERSQLFQTIMKTLKTKGWILTKEEHKKNDTKLKNDSYRAYFLKPKTNSKITLNVGLHRNLPKKKLNSSGSKINYQPFRSFNSKVQYDFGKLKVNQGVSDLIPKEKTVQPKINDNIDKNLTTNVTEYKYELDTKEIEQTQICDSSNNETMENIDCMDINQQISTIEEKIAGSAALSNSDTHKKMSSKQEIKEKFTEGYKLFQMEDELSLSDSSTEDECDVLNSSCEWMDSYMDDRNKTVSDAEVTNTLNHLQEIFNRIVSRYDSTWKRQYEEGYIGFQGDSEDLLKLMKLLPSLESYHIQNLILKWDSFCNKIKKHARKNHLLYAAMVSEMQLFLLDFENDLDQKNIKVFSDIKNSNDDFSTNAEVNSCAAEQFQDFNNLNVLTSENSEDTADEFNINLPNNKIDNSNEELLQIDEINYKNTSTENSVESCFNSDIVDNDFITNKENEDLTNYIHDVTCTKHNNETLSHDTIKSIDISEDLIKTSGKDTIITKTEITKLVENEDLNKKSKSLSCNITPNECNKIGNDVHNNVLKDISIECVNKKLSSEIIDTLDAINPEIPKVFNHPPRIKNIHPLALHYNNFSRVLTFCGNNYQNHLLDLINLPASKTEFLGGGSIRIASAEYQTDFKLFNGCNLGNVELGISSVGMPLAVRRFQKYDTLCNKALTRALIPTIQGLIGLCHDHLLPYLSCHYNSTAIIIVMPLCVQDLGQHIRQMRASLIGAHDSLDKIKNHLTVMVNQVMSGLHYLHTQQPFVVHGNLKPSNVLVDDRGSLRLAEFGVHKMLFQQTRPAMSSMIWWSRECLVHYQETWEFKVNKESDIQSAGMLMYFILSLGQHPFGHLVREIFQNIMNGTVILQSTDAIANDVIYWMLSRDPKKRPTTLQVLSHVIFWSTNKRWNFLRSCCGLETNGNPYPLRLDKLFFDLDHIGEVRNIKTSWISALKQQWGHTVDNKFEDKPSGLLKFLKMNLDIWTKEKEVFLQIFPVLPLNIFRLLEQTIWINHAVFDIFTIINLLP